MRNAIAAFFAASLLIVLAVPVAQAAPTSVNVRIEGKTETIFEQTIAVDVHAIKASSDTVERGCDGINVNDPWNLTPAVTPTMASVAAMSSIGETFDGTWYEGFEDYFVTRWGPENQDPGAGAYWGILVNEVFTNVGGCQYQLNNDDEVLWVYDAFKGRPSLALFPAAANYSSGPRPQRAIAQLGKPFAVEVVSYGDAPEAVPGAEPTRVGTSPYAGAEVAPLAINAKGFTKLEASSPQTVVTDADGKASIVFDQPGIHRIKATQISGEEETVIRSNRLEICVHAVFGDCGEVAPPVAAPFSNPTTAPSPSPIAAPAATRIGALKLDRKQLAQGKVGVSWKLLDAGPGVQRWRLAAKALNRKGARFVNKASGRSQTAATVRLAPGATYKLRLTLTDALGRDASYGLGKVTVPRAGQS